MPGGPRPARPRAVGAQGSPKERARDSLRCSRTWVAAHRAVVSAAVRSRLLLPPATGGAAIGTTSPLRRVVRQTFVQRPRPGCMTVSVDGDLGTAYARLPALPASVGEARRLVRRALNDRG